VPEGPTGRTLGYFSTTTGVEHIVDAETHEIVGSISGFDFPSNTYVTPEGAKVFVDNWGTNEVLVVDANTRTIVDAIQLPGKMLGSLNPAGTRLYETLLPSGIDDSGHGGTVFVIDTATNEVVGTLTTDVNPIASVVSPDGETVYVATLNSVVPIDTATGKNRSDPIETPGVPGWLAITPDGHKVYTANVPADVSVIDTQSNTLITTIPTGTGSAPQYNAVAPDGKTHWATHAGGGIGIVSTQTDELIKVLPTQGMAMTVSFSPDGTKAFVGEGGPNTVREDGLQAIIESASGTWHPGPGNLTIYDAATFELLTRIPEVGEFPGVVGFPYPAPR
jgi:YVTN family beta-propeller protein